MAVFVRNCIFEGTLLVSSHEVSATAVIEDNYFRGTGTDHHLHIGHSFDRLVIRGNVLAGKSSHDILFDEWTSAGTIEVSNNTLSSDFGLTAVRFVPRGVITIRNNLRGGPGFIQLMYAAEESVAEAVGTWNVDHNVYPDRALADQLGKGSIFPRSASDLSATPLFLSKVPQEADYMRVAADSPLAKQGAGGAWPAYVGALKPGLAPKKGDWFTRLRERWDGLTPAKVATLPPPINIPEPAPLAEWLKGRTILTVSQDGKGQFKTIQAALDALKPGQVVKVLDKGPYREALRLDRIPENTGLISDNNTVVELPQWEPRKDATEQGHVFNKVNSFRLSGFLFSSLSPSSSFGMLTHWSRPSGVVIEDCCFRVAQPGDKLTGHPIVLEFTTQQADESVWIRRCLFTSGHILIGGHARKAVVVVEKNYFQKDAYFQSFDQKRLGKVIVRHNVADARLLSIWECEDAELIEISNNTAFSRGLVDFYKTPPLRDVRIVNNLLEWPTRLVQGAAKSAPAVAKSWLIANNWFQDHHNGAELLLGPTDRVGLPRFLSVDPAHRDYLRVPADGPLANGAGGTWPAYIGAFPPGPAPRDGDWFTRLRERWDGLAPTKIATLAPPINIPEPPPLADWLKGRTILTVSQDGKGQYKTIQAALDALKSGQVVKVLDRGPYREALQLQDPPKDVGLVSDAQTVLEISDWQPRKEAGSKLDFLYGHHFSGVRGFRLGGFAFVYKPKANSRGKGLVHAAVGFRAPQALVVEDCAFIGLPDSKARAMGLHCFGSGPDPIDPLVVRGCFFDSSELHMQVYTNGTAAPILLEKNYCRQTDEESCIMLNGPQRRAVVRHNVLEARAPTSGIVIGRPANKQLALYEIHNNTIANSAINVFSPFYPADRVTIRSNILSAFRLADEKRISQPGALVSDKWQLSNNSYMISPESTGEQGLLYKFPDDLRDIPEFLSENVGDVNYLRIPENSPLAGGGAGGNWPAYVGALPPGPAPKRGDWFTRLRERWAGLPPAKMAPPINVPEPPSIAEWLKGRTILTVSQDGKGQFKTIQAALEALQEGQAVKVLDKGPYRERLEVRSLPKDTGLFSEVQTILELPDWRSGWKDPAPDGKFVDIYVGHWLRGLDGFRVNGFDMRFANADGKNVRKFLTSASKAVVLENCLFGAARGHKGDTVELSDRDQSAADGIGMTAYVRDCVFDGTLSLSTHHTKDPPEPERLSTAVIERCYFKGGASNHSYHLYAGGLSFGKLIVRHNVFGGKSQNDVYLGTTGEVMAVELTNNTLTAINALVAAESVPIGAVTIRNNLSSCDQFIGLLRKAEQKANVVVKNWDVDHNAYPDSAASKKNVLPRFPGNPTTAPKFLSKVPQERDYLRIAADDPLAFAGTGGDWPAYLGALPPGPAPKEGDWFTRLSERWSQPRQK